MFYIIILIFLAYMVLINIILNKKGDIIFYIFSIVLTIISAIRYGLGNDYFGYRWHYYQIPDNIIDSINYESHMDIGFRFIMSLFRSIDLNFETFIAILSVLIMTIYIYTIYKYSNNKILSIFIFFSNYYSIYVNSALRQGLGMAIFFMAYYKWLKDKNTKVYLLYILFASLFHQSILIGLIVPTIYKMYNKFYKNIMFNTIFLLTSILLFCIKGDRIIVILASKIGINIEYEVGNISILAIVVRLILLFITILVYFMVNKNDFNERDKFQIYMYFINVCIFISVCNTPIFSRMTDILSSIEIILIPNLLRRVNIKGVDVVLNSMLIIIMSTLFIKDISSFTYQGEFYKKEVESYPYVTIFNKNKIFEYRSINTLYLND